jgi:two-component system chemotaxis sensor kinase CheA
LVGRAIEDDVMSVRLMPAGSIFGPFERMVRDLTRQNGKDVHLVLEGGETEVDRKIVEQIRDPLMHMLRNAVDHGIEPAETREDKGKPRTGTIRVAASQRGSAVEIEVSDDGVGLDASRLRRSAVQKGLLSEDQTAALDDRSAINLIFQPGFSTSPAVTETSGRGVGMDVVREHVERLNGHVEVSSTPGRGTRFTLHVPLTLATSRAILVEQGGQPFAIPSGTVERTARARERQLVSLEGRRAVVIEGLPVPVVDLAQVLEQASTVQSSRDADDWRPLFVLRQGDRRFAFLVEHLVGEQEIVIKSLGWPLRRVRNVSGATILGTGHAVVILNPADLLQTASRIHSTTAARVAPATQPDAPRWRVLVVDDSLTTRTLERSLLEAAGYQVSVATDGLDALSRLRAEPIDLVVSDVDMPRLDGFGLTAELRRDAGLRNVPVILVTSLDDRDHREQGVAAGADAYIVKSSFDQAELLETIRRLL